MKQFKLTGGAKIGRVNTSYPFATLYVDENTLKIDASLAGNVIFQPQDIISIKPYKAIPLIGQGIKILHRVENYKQNVIFWTTKDPEFVISQIKQTGFLEKANFPLAEKDQQIIRQQRQGGFPLKPFVPVVFILLLNGLFSYDMVPLFFGHYSGNNFGFGICIALGLLFLTALMTLISGGFRKLILKDGRELEDVKKFAIFILLICGIMFAAFLTLALSN